MGHRRVQAAKEIGWSEIEGNVVSVSDEDVLYLALKTNIMREGMTERERGNVLYEITQKFNISNVNLAKKIGMSEKWVRSRIRLAMDLSNNVILALDNNQITNSVAEIIGSLEPRLQEPFLLYISQDNNGRNESDVRKAKKRFLNTTIYTMGSEGKDLNTFIQTLKDNGIEQVIDSHQFLF